MRILLAMGIALIASCNTGDSTIQLPDGAVGKGKILNDSILDGFIKLFDSSGKFFGYRTYKNGLPNGPSVTNRNDKTRDSVNYTNGFKSGYVYRLDNSNRVLHKSYCYFDKSVGNTYVYDSIGKIMNYYFYDFSGNILYQRKFTDTGNYESGNLINIYSADRIVNDSPKTVIFVYTIYPPNEKTHYEIAVLDSKNNITKTERITSDFYFETYVNPLPKPYRYAVVVHSFNPAKNKDDIIVQPIE